MKKLTSILSALALVSSLAQTLPASAADTELEKLAMSLCADTEYINAANYYYDTTILDTELYDCVGYRYKSFVDPDSYVYLPRGTSKYADASLGISALEVIAHNGLITASDIAPNARKLSDIKDSDDLRSLIGSYQSVKDDYSPLWFQMNYLINRYSFSDKAFNMIETAEKCQKDGKYFLIMYTCWSTSRTDVEIKTNSAPKTETVHSAVGIGITDGKWTFGGKTYDKCVLTLDSTNVSDSSDAFDEDTCIYINSENGDMYSPLYTPLSETDLHIIAIDDEKLINYKQALKPTSDYDTKVEDIDLVWIGSNRYGNYIVNYSDIEKGETTLDRDNDFLDYYKFKKSYQSQLFLKNNGKYTIDCDMLVDTVGDEVNLITLDKEVRYSFNDSDCRAEIEDNHYKLIARYDPENHCHRKKGNMPYGFSVAAKAEPILGCEHWQFSGSTYTDVEFQFTDEGVIIDGTDGIRTHVFTIAEDADWDLFHENFKKVAEGIYNGDAYEMTPGFADCNVNAIRKTLVSVKDDVFTLKIDLDNDGVYEHIVENGDTNCDGFIDARDASVVLECYSASSTGGDIFLSTQFGDLNGDGLIDSRDASEILAFYAKNSTT